MNKNFIENSKNLDQIDSKKELKNSYLFLARHVTLDYYDCDTDVLLNNKLLEEKLKDSAKIVWATIINSEFNTFEPQWVSWVVVLAESHFTIHTWPEYWYVAIDMFTCWNMEMEKWIDLLTKVFKSKRVELVTDLKRWKATELEWKKWDYDKKSNKIVLAEKWNNWEKEFEENNAWWITSSIDIYWCDPNIIRDSEWIKRYVKELCELIQMKTYWDTHIVHFWEDEKVAWYSMTQLIEISLISGHFANATNATNATNAAFLDIFSCKYYNPQVVADFTVRYFKGKYYKLNINMRDDK